MKILVTGAAGFIGANLTLELQRRFPASSITALDDFSVGVRDNLDGFKGEILEGGVENPEFISSLAGPFDFIFHEAAITDTTVTDEKRMMDVNVGGFKNILGLTSPGKSAVIYASSAGVYGNGPAPMKEEQKLLPLNSYARSKAKMDEIAPALAAEKKINIMGLRYFNVYGPMEEQKVSAASMIIQLARQMLAGKRPRIFYDGEQKRDQIYVKDIVQANISAMQARVTGVVNVGTGEAATFNRIVKELNRVLGTDLEPDYFENTYDFYQNHTEAHTEKAFHLIGFKAKYDIASGIRDYLKRYTLKN